MRNRGHVTAGGRGGLGRVGGRGVARVASIFTVLMMFPGGMGPAFAQEVDEGTNAPNSGANATDATQPTEDTDAGEDQAEQAEVPGRVRGLVWVEGDGDGVRQSGEESLSGAGLSLLGENGAEIDSVASAEDGKYSFEGLAAGTYLVRLDLPEGHGVSTTPDPAAPGAADDSVNAFAEVGQPPGDVTVETDPFEIVPNAEVVLDAGLTPTPSEDNEEAPPTTTKPNTPKPTTTKSSSQDKTASVAAAVILECPNVYALQGGSPYGIYEVDTTTGDIVSVGQMSSGSGTNNGMGISADARYVLSHRDGEVLRFDTLTEVTDTFTGVSGLNATHGAVDPSTGIYYYGNSGNIYAFDVEAEVSLGQVATISYDEAPPGGNGDWSFDAQGNMYVVAGSTASSALYVVNDVPDFDPPSPISVTGQQLTTFTTEDNAINGIAFNGTGSLYVASNAVIIQIDPSTGAELDTQNLDPSGISVDLASCSTPATIVAQKDIVDRVNPGDQFEVTVTGGGISQNNVGTTTGTDTGVQTEPGESAGPVIGLPGTIYDVSEAGASGANLANYTTTWECLNQTNGGAVVAEGTGVSGAFTMPGSIAGVGAAVVCTFINEPVQIDFGDAPASFGTTSAGDGPRHAAPGYDPDTNTAPLMLGSSIDVETDGFPGPDADGDDLDNIDDDDAFTTPIVFEPGTTTASLTVPVTNNTTGSPITLSGWIDANNNGSFQNGEFASAPVPDGATSVTLNWSGLAPFVDGSEPMMRLRITNAVFNDNPGTAVDERALGAAPDGEVEDHPGQVSTPIPVSCGDPYIENFGAGTGYGPPLAAGQTTYLYEGSGTVQDGEYALMANPFPSGGGWWHSGSDHTIGDTDGRMMVINADFTPGIFFQKTFTDLVVGSSYDFGAWITNANSAGSSIAPDVTFRVVDPATGEILGEAETGNIPNASSLIWDRYGMQFAATQTSVRLEVVNNAPGGNGNDLAVDDISVAQVCDFGDAPDSYGTTLANNGPGHIIASGLFLGSEIDSEPDGQPSPDADGDDLDNVADEDGVDINPSIAGSVMTTQAGGLNTAEITATGSGFLNAWIDLDQNGVFDSGEAIFDDEPVVDGVNTLSFTVPDTVSHGQTYARFRLTSQEGVANTPTGPATDGEVEDYAAHVTAPVSQACEAGLVNSGFEAPAVSGNTPFLEQFSGGTIKIYHENVVPGWAFVAADPNAGTEAQRNAIEIWGVANPAAYEGAQFAEINAYLFGYLYQDMVTTPGTTLTWQFAHRGRSGEDTIALNIGVPGATVEQTVETTGNTGWQLYTGQYVVPSGQSITRFEFEAVGSAGGNSAAGNFLDAIEFGVECPTDFGDAPDSYGTTLANDGARHQISDYDEGNNSAQLMLGSSIDKEFDGLPGQGADGDDLDNIDDEDGVTDPIALSVEDPTTVTVSATNDTGDVATLAGWIDLDGNGTFDPGELQTTAVAASGEHDLTFPAATTLDTTYARFRLFPADVTDPSPTGAASGGELEDYPVQVPAVHYQKTVSPNDPVELQPGDPFTYTVTVTNTGSVDLTGLTFSDDLSDVIDDANYVVGSETADIGTVDFVAPDQVTWSGDLAVGEVATVSYDVIIKNPVTGNAAILNGVVGSGPGSNCPPPDPADTDCWIQLPVPRIETAKSLVAPSADPVPGDVVEYQFTIENTGTGPAYALAIEDNLAGVLDDAVYNDDASADIGSVSFEPSTEALTWSGDLPAGDVATVTYSVTVNAADALGDGVLINAVTAPDCPDPAITDPDDPGFDPDCATVTPIEAWTVVKTSDAASPALPGDEVGYTLIVTNTGGADLTGLEVNDDLSEVLDDASFNDDEAADRGAVTYAAPTLTWNGDLATGQSATVTYSVTVNDADELGNGQLLNAVTGGDCPDPAITDPGDPGFDADCVVINDVAAWMSTKTSDAVGTVEPGDTINYTITNTNTGNVELDDPAELPAVTDDLTEVLDDAAYNADADAGGAGTLDYAAPVLSWQGALAVDEVVTITYSVTVNDADELGDGRLANAVVGAPNCPDPAIIDPDDPGFDADCATITSIEAWTVVKTSDAGAIVEPGDEVGYTLSVTNTGGADLTGLEVNDDLSEVLDDAAFNDDEAADRGVASYTAQMLTWNGDLATGQSATITYSVTVNDADDLGDGQLLNAVTGGDCPDPAITDPDNPGFDPDCATITLVEAWTSIKTSDAASPALPGDDITYTIELRNTGGVELDDPAELPAVTDDLTEVLDDAAYNADADAGGAGTLDYVAPVLSWQGALAVDQVVTITYSVTVNDADELGDGRLANAVVGAPNCPDPAIIDPDDPGFNPDCALVELISAWTSVKTSDAATPALPGDDITYTIELRNTGGVVLDDPVELPAVTDNLSEVLDDADYNNDADAGGAGTLGYAEPVLSWQGALAVDQVVTITYSVTVNDADELGDGRLANAVVGAPNCPDPAIIDPGDPGFNPDCALVELISAWNAVKTSDAGATVMPGDVVNYTIEAVNTGAVDLVGADAAELEDDLSEVLDDAIYNEDATATNGAVTVTETTLRWTGDLLVDGSATITYSVTVDSPITGDFVLQNAITGSTNCPDPAITNPDAPDFDADCVVINLLPGIRYNKEISGPPVDDLRPGDTFTYRVRVTNTGQVDLTDQSFSDDLSDVLDDAAYNNDATATTGTVSYTEPILTWNGDVAVGETETVFYTVTIDDPVTGDGILRNGIAGSGPNSNCEPPDPGDPECSTEFPQSVVDVDKTLTSPRNPKPGDVVTYRIRAHNRGGATAEDEIIRDDLSGVLDDAVYNRDASPSGGSVGYSAPQLSWTVDIDPGQTVRLTYSVTVNDTGRLGDAVLGNVVTGGSNCRNGSLDPDCVSSTRLPAVEYEKTIVNPSDGEADAGDEVTYQVRVVNRGATSLSGLRFVDNLSGVLRYATYQGASSSTGSVAYDAPKLTWTGALDMGESATVTYSVRLDNDAPPKSLLRNVVLGQGPGSNCTGGSNSEMCVADVLVADRPLGSPGSGLPFTGAWLALFAAVGLALVLGGGVLLSLKKRSRYASAGARRLS